MRTMLVLTCGTLVGAAALGRVSRHLTQVPMAPALNVDSVNSGPVDRRDLCLTIPLTVDVASECGDLRITHTLPAFRTMNANRAPTLLYNAQFAHPYPLFRALVTLPVGAAVPDSVVARLWTCVSGTCTLRQTGKWAGTDWTAGATRQVALSFNGIADSTGIWKDSVTVTNWYAGSPQTTSRTLERVIVNRFNSPFGFGWWIAGLEMLSLPSMTWVSGRGDVHRYQTAGTNRWVGPSITHPDTLAWNPSLSRYIRFAPGGLQVHFDATGRHIRTVNRQGDSTFFTYSGGLLTGIGLSGPNRTAVRSYTLAYTSGILSSVSAATPGGATRTTSFTRSSASTIITDPDGFTTTYQHLLSNPELIQYRFDRRGTQTQFSYQSWGGLKIQWATTTMGVGLPTITTTLRPQQTLGLPTAPVPNAVDTAKLYTFIDGPRTDVADTTTVRLNRYGAPKVIIGRLGLIAHLNRQDTRLPGLVTETIQPNGWRVTLAYDIRGNDSVRTDYSFSPPAVTRYRWDGRFDQMTRIEPPMGNNLIFYVNSTTGNRDSMADARSIPRVVRYGYNANRQLTQITAPGQGTEVYSYDPRLGNLSQTITPRGLATEYYVDSIGRNRLIRVPIDTVFPTRYYDQRLGYDVLDRIIADSLIAAAVTGATAETLFVTRAYNRNGQDSTITRRQVPNPSGVSTLTTLWYYDRAGRPVKEVAPDGAKDSTEYDRAGNPIKILTRRGHAIVQRYDELNRLDRRITPPVTRSDTTWPYSRPPAPIDTLLYYPYTIPGDTATFTYDLSGNILTANNSASRITRSVAGDGRILSETQQIVRVDRTFSGHVYTVNYAYDQGGRRTGIKAPALFAVAGRDSINYTWDPATGFLTSVRDVGNHTVAFTVGRQNLDSIVTYPGGYIRHLRWNINDGLVRDSVANTSTAPPRWQYAILRNIPGITYDARDKVLRLRSTALYPDTTFAEYNGAGRVIRSGNQQSGRNALGSQTQFRAGGTFTYDPTGNLLTQVSRDTISAGGSMQIGGQTLSYTYQAATARLLSMTQSYPGTTNWNFAYDPSGNTRFEAKGGIAGVPTIQRASLYDAQNQLRIVDLWTGFAGWLPAQPTHHFVDEFRYDALGRRVWNRMQAICWASTDGRCASPYVRRVIWDGWQILGEIQAPGSKAQSTLWEQDTGGTTIPYSNSGSGGTSPDPNRFYGQVLYAHGNATDQPVTITRYSYTDTPTTTQVTWPGVQTIVPFWTWDGVPALGAFADGVVDRAFNGASTCVPFGTGANRCYLIAWQGTQSAYSQRNGLQGDQYYWHGSLFQAQRGATGQDYRRFRYYNPTIGRFTQEDPIGLAGGLNLYGFANGDPVNFSDPFGLCTPPDSPECRLIMMVASRTRGLMHLRPVMLAVASLPTMGMGSGALTLTSLGEAAGAATVTATARIIGSYPGYLQAGEALGAKVFDVPAKVWSTMSEAAQWAANQRFLDRGIKEGAEFILSTLRSEIRRGSALEREVNYLLANGYRWAESGMSLIPK